METETAALKVKLLGKWKFFRKSIHWSFSCLSAKL